MKISEIKALTNERNTQMALRAIYVRLEKRIWHDASGRIYKPSGMTKDFITLVHLGEKTNEGVPFKAAKVHLDNAIDCLSGNFQEVACWI